MRNSQCNKRTIVSYLIAVPRFRVWSEFGETSFPWSEREGQLSLLNSLDYTFHWTGGSGCWQNEEKFNIVHTVHILMIQSWLIIGKISLWQLFSSPFTGGPYLSWSPPGSSPSVSVWPCLGPQPAHWPEVPWFEVSSEPPGQLDSGRRKEGKYLVTQTYYQVKMFWSVHTVTFNSWVWIIDVIYITNTPKRVRQKHNEWKWKGLFSLQSCCWRISPGCSSYHGAAAAGAGCSPLVAAFSLGSPAA